MEKAVNAPPVLVDVVKTAADAQLQTSGGSSAPALSQQTFLQYHLKSSQKPTALLPIQDPQFPGELLDRNSPQRFSFSQFSQQKDC
ncbi:hypothetical protein TNCV_2566601 [Trichonephila clavipes]|uniref:Uncharacterized protein n=1 Tax=Trichonephila clavipes TaxID=2585209 RepID=A0A8X6WKC2_TRICX|nr:hypothetical protein TNCV_2566601 [Trichonephila clavipes]